MTSGSIRRVFRPTTGNDAGADLLWLSLVLFVVLAIAFLLPILPNDYWWYVRIGQDIVRTGSIPSVDTLSYTQAGQPVVYHSWLSAVIFWGLHEAGGMTLTALLRGSVLAAFYALIWSACRQAGAGPRLASILTLIAALAGSGNWAVRPQLMVYPLFGLAINVVWRWQQGDRRWLWLLPLAALVWTNLHGSFVIIFALAGAALIAGGGDRRAMLATFAAMAVASCLNPRGPAEWPAAFSTIANASNQQFSLEWGPPVNAGWQMALFFGWMMLFAPLTAVSPARLSRLHWLWFLGFGWLALSGLRYVIWFLAILPPLSAYLLASKVVPVLDRPRAKSLPALNRVITVLLLGSPLALLPGVRERWWAEAPPALSATTPVAAVRWLKDHPEIPGPLWSDSAYASYLTYALPERPVWIDTRFYPFPPEQWQRYLDMARAAPGWEDLLAQEGIALLMIDVTQQPDLLAALDRSPDWCERYRDVETALFASKIGGQPCAP